MGWSVVGHKNSKLFGSHTFVPRRLKGMKVKVCVRVHWIKGGMAMVVAYCKMADSFKMDSQTHDLVERLVISQRTVD